MITGIILKFEQIDQETYKTIPYVKNFHSQSKVTDILQWIKKIDPTKRIEHVYFTSEKIDKSDGWPECVSKKPENK